jgi:L1 cell adhesion molecule like protein
MHLKNLMHTKNLPNDPKDNMKASEDFLLKVLTAYTISAAKEILKDGPVSNVSDLAERIIKVFVSIYVDKPSSLHACCTNNVLLYSSEVLSLGLLWHNFHDAIREGDGKRLVILWKFLLIVFKASNRTNYSKEAVILLAQYHFLFSERKAQQLLYSRFINIHGRKGTNIPCDLHLEHLNKRLKGVLRNLNSNINIKSIDRAGRSIGIVNEVCNKFEKESSASEENSGCHRVPPLDKEINLLVESIEGSFCVKPDRAHSSFKFKKSLIGNFEKDQLIEWMSNTVGAHVLRCNL